MKLQRLKPAILSVLAAGLKPGPPKNPRDMRRFPHLARLVSVILFALIAVAFTAPASARELKIQTFHSEVIVEPDSSLGVTETIEVNFMGVWHGLNRSIPVEYVTPQGFNYSLFVRLESAKDDRGEPLKVETSRQGRYLKWKIYVNDATDAVRTITLNYRVKNGLKFFEDHDELYWNVTGDESDVPIEDASAHILLPQGATGIHATDYTRARGSRAERRNCDQRHIGGRFYAPPTGLPRRADGRRRLGQRRRRRTRRQRSDQPVSREQLAAVFPGACFHLHVLAVEFARARSARRTHRRAIRAARRIESGGGWDARGQRRGHAGHHVHDRRPRRARLHHDRGSGQIEPAPRAYQ